MRSKGPLHQEQTATDRQRRGAGPAPAGNMAKSVRDRTRPSANPPA